MRRQYIAAVKPSSAIMATLAGAALVVGSMGMAQAAKSDSHAGHRVGVVGVAKQGSTQQRRGTFALPRLVGDLLAEWELAVAA